MLITVYKAAVNSDGIATIVPELHHENQTHSSDQASEEAFERGCRDGLHNHSYDNFNGSAAYLEGYQSGVEQRDHDTSHRYHSGRNDNGYRQAV